MQQSSEKKFEPRYAHTPSDLVFYTDTDGEDYPMFVLADKSIQYKRLPKGAEPLATFHVKRLKTVARLGERGWSNMLDLSFFTASDPLARPDEVERQYGVPLSSMLAAAKEFAAGDGDEVYAKIVEIFFEVYRGEYGEFVAEAPARLLHIAVVPKYSKLMDDKQRWAITFSTLKRMRQKHPIFAHYEKFTYVRKEKKGVKELPYIVIKIPLPSREFEKAFYEALGMPLPSSASSAAAPAAAEEEVEVEKLFEEPEELPPAVPAQPAVQPQPAAQPTAAPAPTAAGAEDATEEEEEEGESVAREELVKLYFLSMRLPSKYLVQRVENEREGDDVVKEVRRWEGETAKLATALQTLRWNAYSAMSRVFAYVEEYGWIAVTEEAVKEAAKVSEYVRKKLAELGLGSIADRYVVRAVPVYLEPNDAKELLAAAVAKLSADAAELKKKIEEAEKEKKEKEAKKLKRKLAQVERLLDQFLLEMRRRGWW
jgi:ribosomal protein L12E/L44/L45/RPP1/RPP2